MGSWVTSTFEAKPDLPGVQKFDADELVNTVSSLRDQVDIIVVSLHWGTEYSDYPEVYQKETAHRLVDAGAKLVIGHHPHCLQGVEMYNGSFIAYSLGNFVFDKQRRPKCWETVLVKTFFQGNDLQKVELYPVMIADEQPRPDTFIGRLASIMQGTTDTTFFVLTVYFGSVGIKRYRHAVPLGLMADLTGLFASLFICHLLF